MKGFRSVRLRDAFCLRFCCGSIPRCQSGDASTGSKGENNATRNERLQRISAHA
jgi:hypothetical protein